MMKIEQKHLVYCEKHDIYYPTLSLDKLSLPYYPTGRNSARPNYRVHTAHCML